MISTRTRLVEARKKKGFTQEQLANRIGISRAYLTNIEKGKHSPSLYVASKLAIELDESVEDLFFKV